MIVVVVSLIAVMSAALFASYSYRAARDNDATATAEVSLSYSVDMKPVASQRMGTIYKGRPVDVSFIPNSYYDPAKGAAHAAAMKRAWTHPMSGVVRPVGDADYRLYVRDAATGSLVEYDGNAR